VCRLYCYKDWAGNKKDIGSRPCRTCDDKEKVQEVGLLKSGAGRISYGPAFLFFTITASNILRANEG
jgi:hypothetical protein